MHNMINETFHSLNRQQKYKPAPSPEPFKVDTNQILYATKLRKDQLWYYVPAYMQLSLSALSKIDYQALTAKMLCNIQFYVNVNGLDQFIIEYLKSNIVLYFSNDNALKLDDSGEDDGEEDQEQDSMVPEVYLDQIKQQSGKEVIIHYLKFSIKAQLTATMLAHIDWTPFQHIDLILTLQPKVTKTFNYQQFARNFKSDKKRTSKQPTDSQEIISRYYPGKSEKNRLRNIKINFNLMDCPNKSNTINYQINNDFGNYKIATNYIKSQFTYKAVTDALLKRADQINEKQQQNQEKKVSKKSSFSAFQYSHFTVVIYKIPNSAIMTILIPLILLGIINLGIFNQSARLAGRVSNLGSLVLAFVSIFPVIRQQIPPSPNITKIEIFVYILTLTDLLCFIQSIAINGPDVPIQGVLDQWIFIFSIIITVAIFVGFIVLLIIHKCAETKMQLFNQTKDLITQNGGMNNATVILQNILTIIKSDLLQERRNCYDNFESYEQSKVNSRSM